MYKDLVKTSVVNTSASLKNKEGYAVDMNGELSSSNTKGCLGIVYQGRPKNQASVISIAGQPDNVQVDGTTNTGNIAVGDPLTAGGGSNNGQMTKATIGTHTIRAYAMETAITQTTIKAQLV